jgi:nucleotide-binding universal stress UspA family protein
MARLTISEGRPAASERQILSAQTRRWLARPILLATDGTAQSIGAFAATVAIAAGGSRRADRVQKTAVRVLTVSDALIVVPPEVVVALPRDYAEHHRSEQLAAAAEQLRQNVGDPDGWRVEVASGSPAQTIANVADEMGASLIVMGLGKHEVFDRVFGSETALRVMRHAKTPVLAVPQNWIGIPRRVLVAVDFGPASLRAARVAMRIVAPGSTVCFAHVAPKIGEPAFDGELAAIYQASLNDEFDRFIAAVGVPDGVSVERVAPSGDAARTLLSWTRTHDIDMIVAGTQGLNRIARLFVGSVASKLIRGAQCAVLVARALKSETQGGDK